MDFWNQADQSKPSSTLATQNKTRQAKQDDGA